MMKDKPTRKSRLRKLKVRASKSEGVVTHSGHIGKFKSVGVFKNSQTAKVLKNRLLAEEDLPSLSLLDMVEYWSSHIIPEVKKIMIGNKDEGEETK